MSVAVVVTVAANGLYTPFRGVKRTGGPVGTVLVSGSVTGDGSGGSASITISSRFLEFGFHPMFAATRIHTVDLSVTLQNVRLLYTEAGNDRINHDIQEGLVPIEVPANNNHANATILGIPIEPSLDGGNIIGAAWETNNNGIAYDLHAFMLVYDMEALAREVNGTIDSLVSGIR